jgi:small ligand-binding sensory domain FIST
VRAAAGAAGTLDVAGCTAWGVLGDDGPVFDGPAAAALVLDGTPAAGSGGPRLVFSGHGTPPGGGTADAGLVDEDATVWSHGRCTAEAAVEVALDGVAARIVRSAGLRPLAPPAAVDAAELLDLHRLSGQPALDHLRRHLPAELRADPPLHRIVAIIDGNAPALPILAAGADGTLTLAGALHPGQRVTWALRSPLGTEQDMRAALAAAVDPGKPPVFALFFSCLGRGPMFYGGEDRDLAVFREAFPGVPVAGAYGSGQIAPGSGGSRLFRNSVVTLLCEPAHVQPLP